MQLFSPGHILGTGSCDARCRRPSLYSTNEEVSHRHPINFHQFEPDELNNDMNQTQPRLTFLALPYPSRPTSYRTDVPLASTFLISRNKCPIARGATPRSSKPSPPVTVQVFPLLVCPYARRAPLTPWRHESTTSIAVA